MRPVNLIPAEERRGDQAPLRAGPFAYILVGVLVALLAGVTALVLTNNQISDSKAEIATLEVEDSQAEARATSLAAYTQFQLLHEQRVETVSSLADSRFDWERVMRELSLVLPSDVWLVSLEATASPEVSIEGGVGEVGALRGSVPGPALVMSGCATGQQAVAGFITALKDIDGVTRVGVQSSELSEQKAGTGDASAAGESSGGGTECRTRDFIAKFAIVVAFDAAPVIQVGSTGEPPATATEIADSTSEETSEGSGTEAPKEEEG
jgi:Tfp pilus assembly protein PilN